MSINIEGFVMRMICFPILDLSILSRNSLNFFRADNVDSPVRGLLRDSTSETEPTHGPKKIIVRVPIACDNY